jgi:hypothetical protein
LEIVPVFSKSASAGIGSPASARQPGGSLMFKNLLSLALVAAAASAVPALAQAQEPNLAGTYRCVPEPDSCKWVGQSLTITQTGKDVTLNLNPNEVANAKITSPITLSAGPPFNALGRIMPDRSIEWSNGTKWVKQ